MERPRSQTAPVDLRSVDGLTLEVKTSGVRIRPTPRQQPVHLWSLVDQRAALEGRRTLADRYVFLVADFPASADQDRTFNAFDPAWWRGYVVPGTDVRTLGNKTRVLETALVRRLGLVPVSLAGLAAMLRTRGAGRNPATGRGAFWVPPDSPYAVLKIAYFRWAYGDLTGSFIQGRIAEFMVLCLGGVPTRSQLETDAVDLRTWLGVTLEVKFSGDRWQGHSPDESRDVWLFKIPARRSTDHRTGIREKSKRRSAAYHVFCVMFAAAAEQAAAGFDIFDYRWWRFYLVPTAALDTLPNVHYINTAKLEKMGYGRMNAAAFAVRLAAIGGAK